MSGFPWEFVPDTYRSPYVSIAADDTPGEPVFVAIHDDGAIQILTMDLVADWAEQFATGSLLPGDCYTELYVRLPGGSSLLPCAVFHVGGTLVVRGTASTSGVLWEEKP